MWNWQKINKGNSKKPSIGELNLPAFKEAVLLYEKKDGKKYAMVGYLSSLDENGAHWNSNSINALDEIFKGFFSPKSDNSFQPTHWCKIETPEDEVPYTLSKISDGTVMSLVDFIEDVESGSLIDDDGNGYYVKDGQRTNIPISPNDVGTDRLRKEFDTIVWYNK